MGESSDRFVEITHEKLTLILMKRIDYQSSVI